MRTASSPTSSAIWSAVPFVPGNVHSADGRQDVLQFVVAVVGASSSAATSMPMPRSPTLRSMSSWRPRALFAALGLSAMAGDVLADTCSGKNGRVALVGTLRQSVFGRLAGYEDVNDAYRLGVRPSHALDRRGRGRFGSGRRSVRARGSRRGPCSPWRRFSLAGTPKRCHHQKAG
jgi:hypothetical protein